jgi:hypothetical protein
MAGTISQPSCPVNFSPPLRAVEDDLPARILPQRNAGQRLDHQRGIDAIGFELRARNREVRIDHGDVLAEFDAFGVGVNLDHLELRPAHIGGKLFALEIGERFDVGVSGEDDEIGKREACAEDSQRDSFLIELLQDGRPADHHLGLAGGEGCIEGRDRRIWFDVELEAVLGVEPPRLHDVPHERIEDRQRQARYGDLRPLLRNRRARPGQGQR